MFDEVYFLRKSKVRFVDDSDSKGRFEKRVRALVISSGIVGGYVERLFEVCGCVFIEEILFRLCVFFLVIFRGFGVNGEGLIRIGVVLVESVCRDKTKLGKERR